MDSGALMSEILVVKSDIVANLNVNQGFSKTTVDRLHELLQHGLFKPRDLMEKDYRFKQIIPYVLIFNEAKILLYKRSEMSDEERLYNKYSIGIGGHIEKNDRDLVFENSYEKNISNFYSAMIREVKEEVGINSQKSDFKIIGFINDDSNDVGKVHLGVVAVLSINSKDILFTGEREIVINRELVDVSKIEQNEEYLESWSAIIFREYLYPK